MSAWHIRPYCDYDLQALTDIYNESVVAGGITADLAVQSPEQRNAWVQSHSPRNRYSVVVVESTEGQLAGFASLSRFMTRAGYDGVVELSYYVSSAYRRQGCGSQVVAWLVNEATRLGYHLAVALIFAGNEGSNALMHKYGFSRYGLLPAASWDGKEYLDLAYWYRNLK